MTINQTYFGFEDSDADDGEARPKTKIVFQPTYDTTHTVFYRGHWLRVRRARNKNRVAKRCLSGTICLTLFSTHVIMTKLYSVLARDSGPNRKSVKMENHIWLLSTSTPSFGLHTSYSHTKHPTLLKQHLRCMTPSMFYVNKFVDHHAFEIAA